MIREIRFEEVYKRLIERLFHAGVVSISRKGDKLTELHDAVFTVTIPSECFAICREPSLDYLKKEFAFYLSGSNRLEDAVACSKFWHNCSDDGETINSNYGKLLLHDRNAHGFTQFEHAVNCLRNNKKSKKAVMFIYSPENAYISNDNPCTAYLTARIDNKDRLHLTAAMRSSDIYFGLPYDVPWFVFIQLALVRVLRSTYPELTVGSYTHIANSLHFYERNRGALERALHRPFDLDLHTAFAHAYSRLVQEGTGKVLKLLHSPFMEMAWEVSKRSKCLKKRVGCVLTETVNGVERAVATGHGGVAEHRPACSYCVRDVDDDKWFGDSCPSIHGEARAIKYLHDNKIDVDYSKVTCYVTANSCDACAKLLDSYGITKVVYDEPYKINEKHWPNITFEQVEGNNAVRK